MRHFASKITVKLCQQLYLLYDAVDNRIETQTFFHLTMIYFSKGEVQNLFTNDHIKMPMFILRLIHFHTGYRQTDSNDSKTAVMENSKA